MKIDNSVAENSKQLAERIRLITDNMISTRERKEIDYRPYRKSQFVTRELRNAVHVNLGDFFSDYNSGDYVYVSVAILCQKASLVSVLVGGISEMYINGVCYCADEMNSKDELKQQDIYLKEGYNDVVFKCIANDDKFIMQYTFAHIFWVNLWVCDYMLWVRDCIPEKEYEGEQGMVVSELVKKNEKRKFSDCKLVYPPISEDDRVIDLNKLYGIEKGKYAISLSYASCDGILKINAEEGYTKVYINGQETLKETKVSVGDEIIVISKRGKHTWGFECETNDILCNSFVTTKRKNGTHWLHIGSFDDDTLKKIQFKDTYENADGEMTFWRFTEPDTYLRPYLDTSFYGQWFYGLMVGEYGLLRASQHYKKYYSYFNDSMSILAEYFHYMKYDAKMFGASTFLKRSIQTRDLDSIGTIGMNLYELYIRTDDAEKKDTIKYVLNNLAECIYKYIPRMNDGTFCRGTTMWADDMYMSCPFLVRMGNLTGDTKYYDEVVLQLKNYAQKLYMEDENIFAHIFWTKLNRNNNVPWGRGNGWIYVSFVEVIEHLPEDYSGRKELMEIFRKAVEGLVKLQDESGMWHQVLNMSKSYLETSCTALFSIAISKGVKLGILDGDIYFPIIKKAIKGLLTISVDECGNVRKVCRGSGCNDDPQYYAKLKTILNDDHGTGVVIAALCEWLEQMDLNECRKVKVEKCVVK